VVTLKRPQNIYEFQIYFQGTTASVFLRDARIGTATQCIVPEHEVTCSVGSEALVGPEGDSRIPEGSKDPEEASSKISDGSNEHLVRVEGRSPGDTLILVVRVPKDKRYFKYYAKGGMIF
jgi:hypothetical protein